MMRTEPNLSKLQAAREHYNGCRYRLQSNKKGEMGQKANLFDEIEITIAAKYLRYVEANVRHYVKM